MNRLKRFIALLKVLTFIENFWWLRLGIGQYYRLQIKNYHHTLNKYELKKFKFQIAWYHSKNIELKKESIDSTTLHVYIILKDDVRCKLT